MRIRLELEGKPTILTQLVSLAVGENVLASYSVVEKDGEKPKRTLDRTPHFRVGDHVMVRYNNTHYNVKKGMQGEIVKPIKGGRATVKWDLDGTTTEVAQSQLAFIAPER